MDNRFPRSLIALYACSVLVAFLVSIIEVEGAMQLGGAQITLSPSQWTWLLPVSVMLPLIIRIFLSKGGTFKWFGIEAQINIAKEAKEAAQYADENDRLDVLRQRSHVEPNAPTAKEIQLAIEKLGNRLV